MDHAEAWELLPDVAAGLSSRTERAQIAAHVHGCDECRNELASLRRAIVLLEGSPAPPTPPASLRERVLAIPDGPDSVPAAAATVATPRPRTRRRLSWRAVLVPVASAAVAAAVTAALVLQSGGFDSQRNLQLRGAAGAPAGGIARLGRADDGNIPVELNLWGLSRLKPGTFYEAWLGRPGERRSIGTFGVDAATGKATVRLTMSRGAAREYDWIWITREPGDGNPGPSKQVILKGALA